MAVSIHNNIVYGPEERQIPAHLSYPQFLFDQLKNGGDKVAIICGETGNSVTYKDILQQSVNLAVSLQKLGLKKGEVVALCSENRFEFPVAALAAMYCGAVVCTLNVTYSPGEITHILKITKPKIIFTSPITAQNVQDCSEGSSVEKIVLFGDYDVIPGLMFKDLVKEQARVENFELADVSGHDTLAVMCSSGTTGLPKGVMLTHINFLTLSQHMKYYLDTSTELNNIEIKNFLALIPWFHAYGFITTFGVLSFHLEIVFLTHFEDKLFLETIQNYKINMMTLVPPLAVFLAKHPLVLKYDLKSVNEVWCGAAPLSADIQNAVSQRLGKNFIRQGYGLTEVMMACCVDLSTKRRLGSCGTPAPGMKIKVIDIETGKRRGVGEQGELWIKSPLRMKGYMGDPAASAALLDQEGYVRTGDIGYYDIEGAFYIVDRLKELIKYNGFQVVPAELEALLLQHPGVAEAGVEGAPHESAGEQQDHVASKDALILGINGACRGIEFTNITINNEIVTFKMRDTKTKTAKSFVIRDEIMNIFKKNPKNIVLSTNTIITAKSYEDVQHASSSSNQQHQSLYTDAQPGSLDPPVYIEHCSNIEIHTHSKSSKRSLPSALYHYYIIILLSLSTTIIQCSQIGDWSQSALRGSNSRYSQQEGRAISSSQPGSVSIIQQRNIREPGGPVKVKLINCPNMRNVTFDYYGEPGGITSVTLTNCANMSNVKFIFNAGPGIVMAVTMTNCPNMANVIFIFYAGQPSLYGSQFEDWPQSALDGLNSQSLLNYQQEGRAISSPLPGSVSNIQQTNIDGPGGPVRVTLMNCPSMRDVTFDYNGEPGAIITVTPTNCANMSNVRFIFNAGPGRTIKVTLTNCPNMSNVTFIFNAGPGRIISVTLTNRPNLSNATYIYD